MDDPFPPLEIRSGHLALNQLAAAMIEAMEARFTWPETLKRSMEIYLDQPEAVTAEQAKFATAVW